MISSDKKLALSRRTFLMGALACAGVPAHFAQAQKSDSGPNDTMLFGCIGVGRQGRVDMQELIYRGLDHNARVVAVCDLDSNRAEQARKLVQEIYAKEKVTGVPECQVYTDFRKLLSREDIDGVTVVTPDHWHALAAIHAIKAGKDVYLEKPMTYTLDEGRQLIAAVREHKRILQVGSQQRSSAYFHKGCELVRNGRIGNLKTITVTLPADKGTGDPATSEVPGNFNYDMWCGPNEIVPYAEAGVHPLKGFGRPGWLQIERYCLGMITGWGAHMNDIAQWGCGTDHTGPIEMEATAEFPKRGLFDVHTTYSAEGKYANGVRLVQKTGTGDVKFEGDEGWIRVARDLLEASDPKLLKGELPADRVRLYKSKSHMGNFLECMRSRKEPAAPVEVGHRSNSVCIITHIAMKLGRKLRWDPKEEKFIDDPEANAMLSRSYRAPWTLA